MDTFKGETLHTVTLTETEVRSLYLAALSTAATYHNNALEALLSPTGYHAGARADVWKRLGDADDNAADALRDIVRRDALTPRLTVAS